MNGVADAILDVVIPASLLGKRTKANYVVAAGAICWGACAALTVAINNWAQASGTRFLVGVFGEPWMVVNSNPRFINFLQRLDSVP